MVWQKFMEYVMQYDVRWDYLDLKTRECDYILFFLQITCFLDSEISCYLFLSWVLINAYLIPSLAENSEIFKAGCTSHWTCLNWAFQLLTPPWSWLTKSLALINITNIFRYDFVCILAMYFDYFEVFILELLLSMNERGPLGKILEFRFEIHEFRLWNDNRTAK